MANSSPKISIAGVDVDEKVGECGVKISLKTVTVST